MSGLLHLQLLVNFAPIPNVAAIFDSKRIMMRPVYEAPKIVPLIHTPDPHAITQADRYTLREVNVVGDKQGLAVADVDDETLMA